MYIQSVSIIYFNEYSCSVFFHSIRSYKGPRFNNQVRFRFWQNSHIFREINHFHEILLLFLSFAMRTDQKLYHKWWYCMNRKLYNYYWLRVVLLALIVFSINAVDFINSNQIIWEQWILIYGICQEETKKRRKKKKIGFFFLSFLMNWLKQNT